MQEGRPRESLVLYETPIEVSLACLFRLMLEADDLTRSMCCRLELVQIQLIPSRSHLEVSLLFIGKFVASPLVKAFLRLLTYQSVTLSF